MRRITVKTNVDLPAFMAVGVMLEGRTAVTIEDVCEHLGLCADRCDEAHACEDIALVVRAIRDGLAEYETNVGAST